jgi:DNA-binding PadR family transcriptional regulator
MLPSSIDGSETVASGNSAELLPGTLDLLILRTLVRGPNHGYGIAQRVRDLSRDVFAE